MLPYFLWTRFGQNGAVPMEKKIEQNQFDIVTRNRIRRKIQHYKDAHGIGVSRLAKRISEAIPRHPEIPIKTLERFLAGRMRTYDMYVGFFSKFAESLPEPDTIGELGRSLVGFFGSSREAGGKLGQAEKFIIRGSSENDLSELTIEPDENFWRLTEMTTVPNGPPPFDGVMVRAGTVVVAALRDRLMGLPKLYMLSSVEGGLSGRTWHAEFSGAQKSIAVSLVRQSDG